MFFGFLCCSWTYDIPNLVFIFYSLSYSFKSCSSSSLFLTASSKADNFFGWFIWVALLSGGRCCSNLDEIGSIRKLFLFFSLSFYWLDTSIDCSNICLSAFTDFFCCCCYSSTIVLYAVLKLINSYIFFLIYDANLFE